MRSERDLDEAIDRAVRDIMSAEPRPGLRGRVLERLEHTSTAWFSVPRIAMAGALLAGIVLAVFLLSRPGSAPVEPASTAATQPQSPSPVVAPPQTPPRPVPEPSKPEGTPTARARPAVPPPGTVIATSVSDTTTLPAQLSELPRIVVVDGIPTPAIVFDKITIQPIPMPPIVIDALRPPR